MRRPAMRFAMAIGRLPIGVGLGLVPDFGGVVNEALGQTEGERGDLVDDDEGVADDGCLDGCGAAGDDGGSGVMEGFAGVGDEGDRTFWPPNARQDFLKNEVVDRLFVECACYRYQEVVIRTEKCGSFEHGRQIRLNLLPSAAGKQSDPLPAHV